MDRGHDAGYLIKSNDAYPARELRGTASRISPLAAPLRHYRLMIVTVNNEPFKYAKRHTGTY